MFNKKLSSITKTCPCSIQRFFLVKKKNENFVGKILISQNLDCGYTSNEYPQSMFWSKNKKNRYTPTNSVLLYKSGGFRGYSLHRHVFLMYLQPTLSFLQYIVENAVEIDNSSWKLGHNVLEICRNLLVYHGTEFYYTG